MPARACSSSWRARAHTRRSWPASPASRRSPSRARPTSAPRWRARWRAQSRAPARAAAPPGW
eukprot:scaffold131453_cov84-Phaeocystis_antarctica.AAC.2